MKESSISLLGKDWKPSDDYQEADDDEWEEEESRSIDIADRVIDGWGAYGGL